MIHFVKKLQTSTRKHTSYPNETAITVISKPNNNSSFRKPYLSKKRNVNVSNIVINVPTHIGIL